VYPSVTIDTPFLAAGLSFGAVNKVCSIEILFAVLHVTRQLLNAVYQCSSLCVYDYVLAVRRRHVGE